MTNDDVRTLTRIAERLRSSGQDRPRFVEGLALGALVGAAIAGSTLWARLRDARVRESDSVEQPDPADRKGPLG